jgi:hypothetical protein
MKDERKKQREAVSYATVLFVSEMAQTHTQLVIRTLLSSSIPSDALITITISRDVYVNIHLDETAHEHLTLYETPSPSYGPSSLTDHTVP